MKAILLAVLLVVAAGCSTTPKGPTLPAPIPVGLER